MDDILKLEADAFNQRLAHRNEHNFIPDLQNYKDNDYFYKSFWRRKKYSDIYVGTMATTYIDQFSKYISPGSSILDFGCGPGYFALELARSGFNVVGYDISKICIESASSYLNELQDPDLLSRLAFTSSLSTVADLKYAGILCSGVLHHLPNLSETLGFISTLFLEPTEATLVFHEPTHKTWTKQDAFVTSLIRLILSYTGNWYEPMLVHSKRDFLDIVEQVFIEYTTERDPDESGGQSPNDLSCDYSEIITGLSTHFKYITSWPSRSFIYRTLGGLRSSMDTEDLLADLLEIIDSAGIEQNFLRPNYMYGTARYIIN